MGDNGPGEEFLAQAVASSPEGYAITSADDELVYANAAYGALVGHSGSGQPPTLARLVAGDEEGERTVSRLRERTLGGLPGRDELRFDLGDGGQRWLGVWTQALGEPPGQIVWHLTDTTPQREVQEVIRKEQEKLADFLDSAPIGFFSVDTEGRFVFVNSTLADWLGYQPEEITGACMGLADFLVEGNGGLGPAPGGQGAAAESRHNELHLKGRDGKVIPVYISQSLARGPGGEAHTRSVVLNLTQEQEWQSALKEAEKRFRRFFDFAPIGIVMVDEEGRVVEANAAFSAMVGWSDAAPARSPLLDLIAGPDRDQVSRRLAVTLEGEAADRPLEIRLAGAEGRPAQLYVSRLEGAPGELSGLVLHFIDTSEQRKLELHFAQSQKMDTVGQLAGGIAHDFNNLLTAMVGFCDLLLLRHQPGDQSFADIMQIKQNGNRAANLVRQLLAFSRQQTLQPKVLFVTDVLAELSNLLRRLIGENIELKMVHGREVGLVKVDQGQFEQVIINLAVNARDAMSQEGGKLTVRTGNVAIPDPAHVDHGVMPAGEYVLIETSDTGRGIKKDDLDKIFEPFFTTKEVGAGTGLGLATVYGIVKQTGGYVFAESELGQGATFRIYLPRHRQAEAVDEAANGAEEGAAKDLTGKGTIVLVEDEDAVRIFAARALRTKGYEVIEADSGEAALELMGSHLGSVDLLVTDVVMPNMDGPTLVKKARELRPDLKVILISGYAEDTYRESLDAETWVNFLPKPFSLKQLAGRVKEVMGAERV
jgi:two-component system cell cycle sensor histidine kinase/response regulator CckA